MRPDRSERKKNKYTKVLFKKSDLTVGKSSIFSDASQRFAKSAISQMKKDLKHHEYYSDKGKLKRDLSLETDICILRRYCKWKLMSLGASSAKSKYSAFNETKDTIEEFEDSSASGDNRPSDNSNVFNVDITVLMMENLRNLLNVWIKKHLMDDSEMKQKFNDVLDSILHKLDLVHNKDSSCTTYVLERDSKDVNEDPSFTCSGICQICRKRKLSSSAKQQKIHNRHSCHSSGKTTNQLRIISTLSIPRKLYETQSITVKETNQTHEKINKLVEVKQASDKGFVAPQKSTMVSVCATSSTKNCFVLTGNSKIKESDIHMLKIFPKLFYKSSSESKKGDTSSKVKAKNKKPFDVVPSLVKSMYMGDPANITSTDANFVLEARKEEYTMTDFSKSKPKLRNRNINTLVTRNDKAIQNKKISIGDVVSKKQIDFEKSKSIGCPCSLLKANLKESKHNDTIISTTSHCLPRKEHNKMNKKSDTKPDAMKITHRRHRRNLYSPGLRHVHCKYFPRQRMRRRVFKKSPEKELEGHVRRIIKYFFEYNGSRSIKFDVKINVCPFMDCDTKTNDTKSKENIEKESNEQSVVNIDCQGYAPPTVLIYTENTSDRYPTIIPLLDGAASHAKYMVDSKNSTTDDLLDHKIENDNVTSQDITELKTIVSNITHTTEKLVQEHLKRKVGKCKNNLSYTKVESKLYAPSPSYTQVEAQLRAAQKQSYTKFAVRSPGVSNQNYTEFEAKLQTVPNQSYTKFDTKLPKESGQSYTIFNTKSQAVTIPSFFNVETKEIQTDARSTFAKITPVPDTPGVSNQNYTELEAKLQTVPNQSYTKFDTKLPKESGQSYTIFNTKSQAVPSPSFFNVETKEIQTDARSTFAKITPVPDINKLLQIETQAKGIQISIATRCPEIGCSGLKLIKEPRKTDSPRYKPIKKSASYAIIESEAILRVTDMTLAVAGESEEKPLRLKSQSLVNLKTTFEKLKIDIENPKNDIDKSKIITFYCDECSKKYEYIYSSDGSVKTKKKLEKFPKTARDDVFSGNHATRVIENCYEFCNGVYPETKFDFESLKPCKFNLPFKPGFVRVLLVCIFLSVLVTIMGGLIYFYMVQSPTRSALKSKNILRVPRTRNQSPLGAPSASLATARHIREARDIYSMNKKSPGFRWFASELGF